MKYNKKCPKCGACYVKKNGFIRGRQCYRCNSCGHVFQNDKRIRLEKGQKLYYDYTQKDHKFSELEKEYKKGWKTLRKEIIAASGTNIIETKNSIPEMTGPKSNEEKEYEKKISILLEGIEKGHDFVGESIGDYGLKNQNGKINSSTLRIIDIAENESQIKEVSSRLGDLYVGIPNVHYGIANNTIKRLKNQVNIENCDLLEQQDIFYEKSYHPSHNKMLPGYEKIIGTVHFGKITPTNDPIVVALDATKIDINLRLLIFRNPVIGKDLMWRYELTENNKAYLEGVAYLEALGRDVGAVLSDGRMGLLDSFHKKITQLCTVHFCWLIERVLTKAPKSSAGKELLIMAKDINKHIAEDVASIRLKQRFNRYKNFLLEKDSNGELIHKDELNAYKTTLRHWSHLFAYQRHPDLKIPSTNNSLEGHNSQIKSHLKAHNGASLDLKIAYLDGYLYQH